ncbi:twin transmembrane helix small protein [Maricaulis sp.]|uniref:twin transmembrane helix small protein n=1 Tax=Maricaulis sp. TaxID=1486257 RepID=UPI002619BF42|nr:twin transmembrane helix small protein [Maricaulis sp.]
MTETFLTGLLYIAMLAVVVVLVFGIVNLYRTGDKARSTSNKLMRLRVGLQFAAVLIIVAIYYVKEQMGT